MSEEHEESQVMALTHLNLCGMTLKQAQQFIIDNTVYGVFNNNITIITELIREGTFNGTPPPGQFMVSIKGRESVIQKVYKTM